MFRSLTPLLCCLVLFVSPLTGERARADEPERKILIADPFIELHSGPGRGYPIFHVVERGPRQVEPVQQVVDHHLVRSL